MDQISKIFQADGQRIGDWMQTYSGIQYWPCDPRVDEVCIEDIAHALSNICRYAGHCKSFYSVAEHSVYVSLIVPPEHALTALLHDATEAYVVDVPRPLKRFLTNYKEIEQRNWMAIADKFNIPHDMPQCIKDADNAVLLAEKEYVMGPQPHPWAHMPLPEGLQDAADSAMLGHLSMACLPDAAKARFMERYNEITGKES